MKPIQISKLLYLDGNKKSTSGGCKWIFCLSSGQSISRVLSRMIIYLGPTLPSDSCARTHCYLPKQAIYHGNFGPSQLAPDRVCIASDVTIGAGRLLPYRFNITCVHQKVNHRLHTFCYTSHPRTLRITIQFFSLALLTIFHSASVFFLFAMPAFYSRRPRNKSISKACLPLSIILYLDCVG